MTYEMVLQSVTSNYQGSDCCTIGIVGMSSHVNAGVDSDTTQAPSITPNHSIAEPVNSLPSFPAILEYPLRKAFEVLGPEASTRAGLLSGQRVMGKESLGKMLR